MIHHQPLRIEHEARRAGHDLRRRALAQSKVEIPGHPPHIALPGDLGHHKTRRMQFGVHMRKLRRDGGQALHAVERVLKRGLRGVNLRQHVELVGAQLFKHAGDAVQSRGGSVDFHDAHLMQQRDAALDSDARQQHSRPDQHAQQQGEQHGGTAQVFGGLAQVVPLQRNAIDGVLDGGVEQLDNEHQQHTACEYSPLGPGATEPQRQRQQDEGQRELLAERRLGLPRSAQTAHGVDARVIHAR